MHIAFPLLRYQMGKKWKPEEFQAVEKSLKIYIRTGSVPGKQDCEKCIAASPEALAERVLEHLSFVLYI